MKTKPLGKKNYGSIPHLSGSRLGEKDYCIGEGQERIATIKVRDKNDVVMVQEKLDGANVGIYKKADGELYALTRGGYNCHESAFPTHHKFNEWFLEHKDGFNAFLKDGERLCGEWLYEAVGTKYNLVHDYFVPFDIMIGNERLNWYDFNHRLARTNLSPPALLHIGRECSIAEALSKLGVFGHHGAQEPAEGLVYRIERNNKVDFLCKYVRKQKVDGKYLNQNIINEKAYTISRICR